MASYFSVVRFVPSALAEEFINVGVLAFGDGKVRSRFLESWNRLRRFAGEDVLDGVKEFQDWVEASIVMDATRIGQSPFTEEVLKKITKEWAGSLRISEPRGSALDADTLLEQVAPIFLVEPPAPAEKQPTKAYVRALTREALEHAIVMSDIARQNHLRVQTRLAVKGHVRPRTFDVVVTNGLPRCAVQCFSFLSDDSERLLKMVDATAFAIEDATKASKELQIAVVALGPEKTLPVYSQAKETFESVGASFVTPEGLEGWSNEMVMTLSQG